MYESSNPDEVEVAVQWAAPEALETKRFTTASDVWSFAMMMIEVFTCGQKPFGNMMHVAVEHTINSGKYPAKPERCPAIVYELLQLCWSMDRAQRPLFESIETSFTKHSAQATAVALPPDHCRTATRFRALACSRCARFSRSNAMDA